MLTLEKLIETLRDDFSCTLKSEKIISLVNSIEKMLFNEGFIKEAKTFTPQTADKEFLSLGSEHSEVYMYHILSREALMHDDIDRLNNFSTLYAKSLSKVACKNTSTARFKNIW